MSHQYASLSLRDHRSMLSGRDFTILSLDLNQDEDEIITETDSASYNRFFVLSPTLSHFEIKLSIFV